MGKQRDPSGNFDMRKAMELAGSPAGRQLIKLLQSQNNPELQTAISKAAAGDFKSAQVMLSSVMENPEVRDLLRRLEG